MLTFLAGMISSVLLLNGWRWLRREHVGFSDSVAHGPFCNGPPYPWWRWMSLTLVRTTPGIGWRLWIYTRWGACKIDWGHECEEPEAA
jgi:hypothetical protein